MLSVYGVCGAAGLVVGAIHGRVLVQLLKQPSQGSRPRAISGDVL
jgi:hypothetical protein